MVMAIDRNGIGKGASAGLILADVIEIKLPPSSEYLAVVRATIGVIAGNMSFNYDEVIQLRVAASEVFNLAMEWVSQEAAASASRELALQFIVEGNKLEILVPNQINYTVSLTGDEMVESRALLVLAFSDNGTHLRGEKHEGDGGFGLLVLGINRPHQERSHKCLRTTGIKAKPQRPRLKRPGLLSGKSEPRPVGSTPRKIRSASSWKDSAGK